MASKKKSSKGKKPQGTKANNSKPQGKKTQATPKKSSSKTVWIVAAVALAAVVGLIALSDRSSQNSSASALSPQEAKYVGRLLPAGYAAPKVADFSAYSAAIPMSPIAATPQGGGVSVSLQEILAKKIVRFDYQRADGNKLPMIAYVKPSGALFVGVSYCPPCEGEGQRIEADGTLTCEACGTKRNLETNAGISGACKLYPLDEVPTSIDGDKILVDGSVLDSWTAQPLDRPIGG
ncbi:MAG: DUF2318 domain-containing protein [Coriobacteriia bacterium]|nr:DUF2318 domain-containing protein [Coriobacteriia bacterium]